MSCGRSREDEDDATCFNIVNKAEHYNRTGLECIDVAENIGLNRSAYLFNAFKYIWRAGHKNDAIEDLKKARYYLDREIKNLEDDRIKK